MNDPTETYRRQRTAELNSAQSERAWCNKRGKQVTPPSRFVGITYMGHTGAEYAISVESGRPMRVERDEDTEVSYL